MDVDKSDTSEKIAEVSNQGEEETIPEKMVDGSNECMGFNNDNKVLETMGVFDRF